MLSAFARWNAESFFLTRIALLFPLLPPPGNIA
jgi:hypothetical protein